MTWVDLPDNVKHTAEQALTRKQLHVWMLELAYQGNEEGGVRTIAKLLDVSPATVRDHRDAAHRNLRRAGVRQHPNGDYYIKEAA